MCSGYRCAAIRWTGSTPLLGSDAVRGNLRCGLVFDLLGLGEYANPRVILDKSDKAHFMGKSPGGLSSPTGVLHSLLEPVSAALVALLVETDLPLTVPEDLASEAAALGLVKRAVPFALGPFVIRWP